MTSWLGAKNPRCQCLALAKLYRRSPSSPPPGNLHMTNWIGELKIAWTCMRGRVRSDPGMLPTTLTRRLRCGEGGAPGRTKAAAAGSKPGSDGALLTWPCTDGESAPLLPSVSPPAADRHSVLSRMDSRHSISFLHDHGSIRIGLRWRFQAAEARMCTLLVPNKRCM